MKFSLGEIRHMKDPLGNLLDKDLPIKSAWRLNRLIKTFDKELGEIEEFRVGLIKKLTEGVEPDQEGQVSVPKEKMGNFVEEFNELLVTEVEVDFEPLSIDDFGDINITAKDLMLLDKIIS